MPFGFASPEWSNEKGVDAALGFRLMGVNSYHCVEAQIHGSKNIIEFLKEGTNSQKALAQVPSKLSRCCIVAPWQTDVENPKPEHFMNLKVMLEVMCNQFSFINRTIRQKEGNQ